MSQEEKRLRELRSKMSNAQRQQMSEVIQNEMKRRGMSLSDLEENEMSTERPEVEERKSRREGRGVFFAKVAFVALGVALGGAKIFFGGKAPEVEEARARLERVDTIANPSAPPAVSSGAQIAGSKNTPISPPMVGGASEGTLGVDLDARRVELEKRGEALDRREEDLKAQAEALTERLAELRGLTARLGEVRKTEDTRQETKLDQLANVYTAMAPNEAATLLSRLEPSITLELLQRMPEKRIGQILGLMERDRAVELTRLLTERKVQ